MADEIFCLKNAALKLALRTLLDTVVYFQCLPQVKPDRSVVSL